MTNNAKHYDYYLVEGSDVKELIDGFDLIGEKRKEIFSNSIKEVDAVAWIKTDNWGGGGGLLQSFVFDAEKIFPCEITIKRRERFNGKSVIVAIGKGNTKEGRAYNKILGAVINKANEQLKALPEWKDYIINHYGIMRTGFGEASGRGFGIAMLSTYGGKHPERDDCLIFAIPNNEDEKHCSITIPDNFQKITYGQFYDISTLGDK